MLIEELHTNYHSKSS